MPGLFLAFALALLAAPAAAADLEAILERHTSAIGGAPALARIISVRVELEIREPGFEVTGTYIATRAGDMRIDIMAGDQRVFAEGLNDGQAWEWTPSVGRVAVGGEAAAALRHGIDLPGRFFTFAEVRERGARVGLVEGAADAPEWQLRVTLPDGFVKDYWLDRETHLVTRTRDLRAFHPSIDPTEVVIETRHSEPRWTGGVLSHTRIDNVNAVTGEWLGTTRVRSVEYNIGLPAAFFAGADLQAQPAAEG